MSMLKFKKNGRFVKIGLVSHKGDPFKYEDFTPEQLAELIVKIADTLDIDDLTPEQINRLHERLPKPVYDGEYNPNTNKVATVSTVASKVKEVTDTKGASNGIASLDGNGKVPSSQLPSFVDSVVEYDTLSSFPVTGESGKIYVAIDTDKTYRWSGSQYTEISASLALGETSSSAFSGDKGKEAYDHSKKTGGNPHKVTITDLGLKVEEWRLTYEDETTETKKVIVSGS